MRRGDGLTGELWRGAKTLFVVALAVIGFVVLVVVWFGR